MKMFKRPQTLFARTGLTIAVALCIFFLLTTGIIVNYMLLPLARRGTEDLSALIVLSAQTWVELPPTTRRDFQHELLRSHNLTVTTITEPLSLPKNKTPYMRFLERALTQRLEQDISIKVTQGNELWLWVDIPMADRILRFGFPHERIGTQPPLVALVLVLGGIVITLLASLVLVRKITHPVEHLADAAERFGKGEKPAPLPEDGPRELAILARRFNHMMQHIEELLENRTTLLAGISHDLRTPIARMQLALEMLRSHPDPQLINRLDHDLWEMNQLIQRTLEFTRGLDAAHRPLESVDITALMSDLTTHYPDQASHIEWTPEAPCRIQTSPLALRRVIANLLENALRYGHDKPVMIQCQCLPGGVTITIADRGPGIPEDQLEAVFQPFHRLEASRSSVTGGSGLGLAIVHQLCKAHGWQIQLLPGDEGGTVARLHIPVSASV